MLVHFKRLIHTTHQKSPTRRDHDTLSPGARRERTRAHRLHPLRDPTDARMQAMAVFRASSHAELCLACFHTHHTILPRHTQEIERAPHTFHQHQHSHCRAFIHTQCVQAHSTNSHNTLDNTRHAQTAPPASFSSHSASATTAGPPKKFPQGPARLPPLSLQPSLFSSNSSARGREHDTHSQPQRRLRHPREHHRVH